MNSKELYVTICQILAMGSNETIRPTAEEFSRPASIQLAHNHGTGIISHATVEFVGVRAKFLCTIIFDGAGPHDTSVHNFNMPRTKLSMDQKALMCLAVVEFLIDQKALKADFNFIREKVLFDINSGVGSILRTYDNLKNSSATVVRRELPAEIVKTTTAPV